MSLNEYIFVLLIVSLCAPAMGADSTKLNTPDGTITFNLPNGYYINTEDPFSDHEAFVYDGGWSIEALKDGLNGEKKSYYLNIQAYDTEFQSKVDEFGQNDFEESYTKTASGNTAWIGSSKEYEGRYNAFIELSKEKVIQINSIPGSDATQPQAGMTATEFKDFVESIEIE